MNTRGNPARTGPGAPPGTNTCTPANTSRRHPRRAARHHRANSAVPRRQDRFAIRAAPRRVGGVIARDRIAPIAALGMQAREKGRRRARVRRRIERLLKCCERIRMIEQTHLKASDIDRAHTARRQHPHLPDRLGGAGGEQGRAIGVDRKRGRGDTPGQRIGAPALDAADRAQHTSGEAEIALRHLRRPLAPA